MGTVHQSEKNMAGRPWRGSRSMVRLWEHGEAAGYVVPTVREQKTQSLNSGGQFVFFVMCSGEPRLWDGVAHIWGVFHLN